MDRFLLLRLPTVALIEVLKCFNPIELYQLSFCPGKLKELIRLAGTKTISLDIDFRNSGITMNKKYEIRFGSNLSDVELKPDTSALNIPDDSETEIVDQMKTSGYYISALFKCPIKSLIFGNITSSGQCRSIIEEVITAQDSPLENLILSGVYENEDLKWILEKIHVTGHLRFSVHTLQNFSVDLKLTCRHFYFYPARWATLDNLVCLESCVTFELLDTNLTYQDLDILMGKWKSGMFPNLEYLRVYNSHWKNDGKILGFSMEQLRAERGSERKIYVDNECYGICDRGVDVTNNDGIRGSIQILWYTFELFVWKD